MLEVVLEAIGLGLAVSFSFGPAFWAVIQTGIDRGFKWGVFLSLGILASDAAFIIIAYIGASSIFNDASKFYIGLIGGLALIGFGIYTFFKKPEILKRRSAKYKTPKDPTPTSLLAKGFVLNIANPFIFFFWLAAMGFVTAHSNGNNFEQYVLTFFGVTLATIFSSDLLKCYIGNRFKKILRPRVTFWLNRIIGTMLIIFGLILIYRVSF